MNMQSWNMHSAIICNHRKYGGISKLSYAQLIMDYIISGPYHSYNVLYSILSWQQALDEIIGYILYCHEQKKVFRKGVAKHISLFIKYLILWHLSLIKIFDIFFHFFVV